MAEFRGTSHPFDDAHTSSNAAAKLSAPFGETIAVPVDRGAFMGKRIHRLKIGFGTWFTRTWLP